MTNQEQNQEQSQELSQERLAEQVFGDVIDLPVNQRTAFLLEACNGSMELRDRVDALLHNYEKMGSFLVEPAFNPQSSEEEAQETSQVSSHLAVGRRLGRYTITEPLGHGGMGSVFRARDEKLERTVAIKVLSRGVLTSDESRRRFRKEALALAKLSHAHIAAVYDVGEQDGVDYIVMECVPGQALSTKLKSGPLTVQEATSIVLQIAQALEEAHENGIVHRDLKPANVIITPKGQAKVLDFGIAKLLAPLTSDATLSMTEADVLIGTPRYMSPEQAQGKELDARTDLWSLGVVYYELLTGRAPFQGKDSLAVLRAIVDEKPVSIEQLRPDSPELASQIVSRALQKDPAKRYTSAALFAEDTSELLNGLSSTSLSRQDIVQPRSHRFLMLSVALSVLVIAGSLWFYHRLSTSRWVREEAIPQAASLQADRKPLAAFLLLNKARAYTPSDKQLQQLLDDSTTTTSVTSSPTGATVQIQDYLTPKAPWYVLGTTPLSGAKIPKGYFRWKVSKAGAGEIVVAKDAGPSLAFPLDASQSAPAGMVLVPARSWGGSLAFTGWMGRTKTPAYYVDRYEVTNRDYQQFVDSGGYDKQQYWLQTFQKDRRELSWNEAMSQFRDTTGRPGPSTWVAGHFREGQGDLPVTGVSWFEALAYAAFAGKSLPVVTQWFEIAPPEAASYTMPLSNMSSAGLARGGAYQGIGPYGTYDTAGNAREWIANAVDGDLHFIFGGSWKAPEYLYFTPEALSPFDRSDTNGFRCVKNLGPLDDAAQKPIIRTGRDFEKNKPIPDDVFHAYTLLYAYPKVPLAASVDGVVNETADWIEQRVSYDDGRDGQRISAHLFLPKHVKPPYQTVLFFPSARVLFLPNSSSNGVLGDVAFFDYIIQSGRAVMYPIYEGTYERRVPEDLPRAGGSITLTVDRYKDAARSLDYLNTREDIDSSKLAYLGVSMGSAYGVIFTSLLQDRLQTAIFLDGGFFMDTPRPGADAVDFAARMKKPVLMVNGRYDFTFPLEKSQKPLFDMLGTPPNEKRHIVLDTPHDVTEQRPRLIHEVLDWLDRYLGRV